MAQTPAPALATYHLGRGWATFGLALPQGASTGSLAVGTAATQTDVKTTWPDGSTRFAVVTSWVNAAGDYAIRPGPQAVQAIGPTWPAAAVYIVTGGLTYAAVLPATPSGDMWLTGGLVQEQRVVVTPVASGIAHPLLQVVFDVRGYAGGGSRVDVTVQNTKDVTAGAPVTYDVGILINKQLRFSKAAVRHPYLTRWRQVFEERLTVATVTPDFTPFYTAHAVPRFRATVVDPIVVAQGPKFDILGYGDMSPDMSDTGGRPEIAPYPNWVAQYLTHERPEQRAYMLAQADRAGSWAGHITEPDGQTLVTLDMYPNYWLDGRAGVSPDGPNAVRVPYNGGLFPGGWSQPLETAHIPALTFVPYLVTGDRFYLDEMKLWANFTLIRTYPGTGERQGGKGILMENQPRGFGWAMRNLADLTAFLPDADTTKGYFRTRLQNNLDFLDNYARTNDGGPLGFVFVGKFPVNANGNRYTSLWQSAYVGWALDRATSLGFGPVAAMRDRVARTQVLFFSSDAVGYPRIDGAPYYPDVAKANPLTWYAMGQVYTESQLTDPRTLPFVGLYGVEARLMLQIGARQGMAGAQAALDYLMLAIAGDVDYRSGWAVLP